MLDLKDPKAVAAIVSKVPSLAAALAEAKPKPIEQWADGSPKDESDLYDDEHGAASQEYFERSQADGSYARAMYARRAQAEAEKQATAEIERLRAQEAMLAELDARDRARNEEEEARRLEQVAATDAMWKSAQQLPGRKPAA